MASSVKRRTEDGDAHDSHQPNRKRQKSQGKKQWRVERKSGPPHTRPVSIEPGDSGILATCTRGKEARARDELYGLLQELVCEMYPAPVSGSGPGPGKHSTDQKINGQDSGDDGDDSEPDIEAEFQRELSDMKASDSAEGDSGIVQPVKVDIECIIFFKLRPPVEPTAVVDRLCRALQAGSESGQSHSTFQRTRFVLRLTPITLVGKASEQGLEEVVSTVLAPHFHGVDQEAKKFAIRPSFRNHTTLKRDAVIQQVAKAVGPGHSVDLTNYDHMILVDVWKNLCGMAVVGSDYEELKRYNIAELQQQPRPKSKDLPEAGTSAPEAGQTAY